MGSPDAGKPIGAEFCDVYRMACRRQVECGVAVVNQEESEEACELTAACDAMLADFKGSGQVVRAAEVSTCIAALQNATCTALANGRLNVSEACNLLHGGTKKKGESCGGGVLNDCEPGLVCNANNTCPGVCEVPEALCGEGSCPAGQFCSGFGKCEQKAALGQECDWTQFDAITENSCVDGAYCNNDRKCVASGAPGSSCSEGNLAVCAAGSACIDGTCQTAKQNGEDCVSAFECGAGLYCNFVAGKCEARLPQGAACSSALGACSPGLRCQIMPDAESGTCLSLDAGTPVEPDTRPIAESNGDCSDAICPLGTVCKCSDTNCAIQRCKPAPKLGEKCTDEGSFSFDLLGCSEGICDLFGSGTCVRPQPVGAECNSFTPMTFGCVSGACMLGKCASSAASKCD